MNPGQASTTTSRAPAWRTVQRAGCTLVHGSMLLGDFLSLVETLPTTHVIDLDLARLLGAHLAVGSREALDRLREEEGASSVKRLRTLLGARARRLQPDAVQWLATGEQGPASLSLFMLLSGVRAPQHGRDALDLPQDVHELRHCRLMLEHVPSLSRMLPILAGRQREPEVSAWAALAESWDDVCAQMDFEMPEWRLGVSASPALAAMLACFQHVGRDGHAIAERARRALEAPVSDEPLASWA